MVRVSSAWGAIGDIEIESGSGSILRGYDGRTYVDLVAGQGAVILGHVDPVVNSAVIEQLRLCQMVPGKWRVRETLREKLSGLYPKAEDMLTFKTGSEAVHASMRIVRAATGRQRMIRVGFGGWHDGVVSPYVRCHSYDVETFDFSFPPGVDHERLSSGVECWFGDSLTGLFELVRERRGELAGVILDPVQVRPECFGQVPALVESIHDAGGLVIFDESKTGFRVSLGGAQSLFGVQADLTVLSKALANGFPLAVLIGREELIGLADDVRIKGTFADERVSIAAAIANLGELERRDVPTLLGKLGEQVLSSLNAGLGDGGLSSCAEAIGYQWPCMPYVGFSREGKDLEEPFYALLAEAGVLMLSEHMSYVTASLEEANIERIREACTTAAASVVRSLN